MRYSMALIVLILVGACRPILLFYPDRATMSVQMGANAAAACLTQSMIAEGETPMRLA